MVGTKSFFKIAINLICISLVYIYSRSVYLLVHVKSRMGLKIS